MGWEELWNSEPEEPEREVRASLDFDSSAYILADVTKDDAWVSIELPETASLSDYQ